MFLSLEFLFQLEIIRIRIVPDHAANDEILLRWKFLDRRARVKHTWALCVF